MRLHLVFPLAALAACLAGPVAAQPALGATAGARATERCEAAATETLRQLRGRAAQEVQFTAAERSAASTDGVEFAVKGAGRYRAAVAGRPSPFTFSCAYNVKTGLASGVVLREPQAAPASAAANAAWQPDLSRLSPEACESAAARVLKDKNPRVDMIAMESDSRRLEPGADERIVLHGRGAIRRAPGMNAMPFSYRCEFDGRSGRLTAVSTTP